VIQNNIAQMRSVKPGVTDGGMTQVDGINPGDVVANSSFDKLQNNTAVVVSNPAPSPASAKPTPAATSGSSAP
jgi:multidrug efflux system membrane fusion protein